MGSNTKKADQLGMPIGTASHRLRKNVLFHLLVRHNENICFRCEQPILNADDLSMEHKEAWMDVSVDLFWDVNNIAFSHLHCNSSAARNPRKGIFSHPSCNAYREGCRCQDCKDIQSIRMKKFRERKKSLLK